MKAIEITQHGDPEVLELKDIKLGKPGADEVTIEQKAIGLNYIDTYHRSGLYPLKLPSGLGAEGAGIITEVGSNIKTFKVGDKVSYAGAPLGSYSTHRNYPINNLVKVPDNIDLEVAATLMTKGLTTFYLLHKTYPVKSGQTILFHAAAGGVGLIAGQWMQVLGAKTIGTAGSDEKCNLAKDHGYGETINYSNEDFLQRVQEITNQSGVDVVYDSVGKDTMFNSFKALKRHGTVVSFGQSSGAYTDLQMTDLAFGSFHLTRPTLFHFYANRNWLENASAELFELISNEKVKLDQVTKYPLENVAQVHTDIENRKTTGSVILEI